MAVNTLLQFVQDDIVGAPGQSLFGVLLDTVTVGNGGTNPLSGTWTFTVLDSPPGSAVSVGVAQIGPLSTWSFSPDYTGGYLISLKVDDGYGNISVDTRCFGIRDASGLFVPPFAGNFASLNFGGQARGWATYMEEWFAYILALGESDRTLYSATAPVTVGDTTAQTSIVGAGIGSMTIPGGLLGVGSALEFKLSGLLYTAATTQVFNLQAMFGSAVVLQSPMFSLPAGMEAVAWEINARLAVQPSIGVPGVSFAPYGQFTFNLAPGSYQFGARLTNMVPVPIDNGDPQLLDVLVTWSTASSFNVCTCTTCVVKYSNPRTA